MAKKSTPKKAATKTKNKGINPSEVRTRWVNPLGKTLDRLTKSMLGRQGFVHGAIVTKWPEIIGENMARHTAAEKIVFSRDGVSGGTLHLRCDSGALATELMHLEPQIVDRINTFFGYQAVIRLQLVQGPLPNRTAQGGQRLAPPPRELNPTEAKEIAETVAIVDDDDELREALERLGQSIKSRNEDKK